MTVAVAYKMEFAGTTDVGRSRSRNEDSYDVNPDLGLALVCDGMGGHAGGDVASHTAAETIIDFIYEYEPEVDDDTTRKIDIDTFELEPEPDEEDGDRTVSEASNPEPGVGQSIAIIRSAVQRANRKLITLNQERGYQEGRGMGTTVVGLWMVAGTDKIVVFHAGDSRLYRLRNGVLQQLTRDHSLYQAWLDSGAHGQAPQRNIIVRALGTMREVEPEVSLQAIADQDVFLLCSDGLTSMLPDDKIAEALRRGGPLPDLSRRLVELANQSGGYDNITVVLARCVAQP